MVAYKLSQPPQYPDVKKLGLLRLAEHPQLPLAGKTVPFSSRTAQKGREDFCALDFPSGESMPSIEYGVSGGGRAQGSATAATPGPSAQAAGPFYLRRRQER